MQELNAQISNRLNFNYLEKTLADDSYGDGFHLPKSVSALADMYKCETESIASSATSKRLIDRLFGETRSVSSEYQMNHRYDVDYQHRKVKSLIEGGIDEDRDENTYYQEPQQENLNDVQVRIEKMFSEVSSSEQETEQANNDTYVVQHLGSIPIQSKIISVNGLQEPLTELFFKYQSQHKKNDTGLIQIGNKGLQIEYNSNYGGKIEKLYPFSNIAIWASLKFCHRINDNQQYEYAFVPLVTDSDTSSLFTVLDQKLVEQLTNTNNVPIFTIVMREPDIKVKQLVCYGFICESSEDAVIIAATLYRVLMNKLGKNRSKKVYKKYPKEAPNRLCSIGETSLVTTPKDDHYASVEKQPATESTSIPPPPPARPPRKLKKPPASYKMEGTLRPNGEGRDILTKIAIPRSNSFLNTNRLSCRYKDSKPATNEAVIQKTTANPLGFIEIFNELQSQEGLKTIDEILQVIIKSEGMSYNELKPIYKEFLLKLALVLNKDELYNRSRAIMKSQKQNRLPTSSQFKIMTKSGWKNIFHKPLVKLRIRNNKDSTRVASKKNTNKLHASRHTDGDGTSTDSFMLSNKPNQPDLKSRILPKNNNNLASTRQKPFRFHSQGITSTSEDSDYPNINQKKVKNKVRDDALRPSSSGYFSFSECSCDTESCTCNSADKCYCSLGKNKLLRNKPKTVYSMCSCDTIKCRKRNKCYCMKPQQQNKLSLVDQLKQKGFTVSESSLSHDDTKKISSKERSNTKLSKSLEYLETSSQSQKSRMEHYDIGCKSHLYRHSYKYNPSYSSESSKESQKRSVSSDNLAIDYSMFAKSDERNGRKNTPIGFTCCTSKRLLSRKQNVIYAELARPKFSTSSVSLNKNYSIAPRIIPSVRMESPSMLDVYPNTPIKTCNCACSYQLQRGELLQPYKNIYGSTPFHRMNMENIFGYFP